MAKSGYRKTVRIEHFPLRGAREIEDILCLATLIAKETLPYNAKVENSKEYYEMDMHGDCGICPHVNICLASIINE
jgi:hypothetical protein